MAVLTTQHRRSCLEEWMRRDFGTVGAVTKADVLAAVNALDDYLEANRAAINTAIPQPARAQLTTHQKIRILQFVLQKRLEQGSDG